MMAQSHDSPFVALLRQLEAEQTSLPLSFLKMCAEVVSYYPLLKELSANAVFELCERNNNFEINQRLRIEFLEKYYGKDWNG